MTEYEKNSRSRFRPRSYDEVAPMRPEKIRNHLRETGRYGGVGIVADHFVDEGDELEDVDPRYLQAHAVTQAPLPVPAAPVQETPAPEPEPAHEPESKPAPEPTPELGFVPPEPEPVVPESAPAPEPEPKNTQEAAPTAPTTPPGYHYKGRDSVDFATFHVLYESRDTKLCVFEDENGHLAAVDASRLM